MDEIKGYLASPAFWFSSLFVGLIIGIVGSVLGNWATRATERRWGAFTEARRQKQQTQSEERKARIALMVRDDDHLRFGMQDELKGYHWLVVWVVMAVGWPSMIRSLFTSEWMRDPIVMIGVLASLLLLFTHMQELRRRSDDVRDALFQRRLAKALIANEMLRSEK